MCREIAFGWHARGGLRQAYSNALERARDLALLISSFRGRRESAPHRALPWGDALPCCPALSACGRCGAYCFAEWGCPSGAGASRLKHTCLGRKCQMFHVTSGENALFDSYL